MARFWEDNRLLFPIHFRLRTEYCVYQPHRLPLNVFSPQQVEPWRNVGTTVFRLVNELIFWYTTSMGLTAGGNGNDQWDWEGSGRIPISINLAEPGNGSEPFGTEASCINKTFPRLRVQSESRNIHRHIYTCILRSYRRANHELTISICRCAAILQSTVFQRQRSVDERQADSWRGCSR